MDVSVAEELLPIELTWDEALILDMALDARRDAVSQSVAELRFHMLNVDAAPMNKIHSEWVIAVNTLQQKLNLARMKSRDV